MDSMMDSHVHTQWSWDARGIGSMERSCERAVAIGLPAIAFTEHLDHTAFRIERTGPYALDRLVDLAGPDDLLTPPPFDVAGYLASIEHCRDRFPGLRILTGLEMGEPHRHARACAGILAAGRFDRVLGSLHSLPDRGAFAEPWAIYPHRDAYAVMREYLAAVTTMVSSSDLFAVLAHIDYPVRSWPSERHGPFDPHDFEDEFRAALRATAASGRALEINTRIPLDGTILRWWHEVGGDAVTFGSDAHEPSLVAHGFRAAADMAAACGFRAGETPYALWSRVD